MDENLGIELLPGQASLPQAGRYLPTGIRYVVASRSPANLEYVFKVWSEIVY